VSAHIKWFAILLILAAPVTVCASDESDVKDAAKSFATGLAKGDADQTKQYATSDANTVAIIDGLAPIVAASHRLHDAAVDKFGKDGERLAQNPGGNMSEWSKRADQSAARITGDTATLSAREDPADKSQASSQSQPQPLHLKKEGGKWKVDLAGTPNAQSMKQQAPLFKAMAKAMDETAGEVKDGKYQNVNQAQAALRQKVAAAVVDSRGGVPSGSYRGRGSNGSGGAGGRGPNQ
jgi:hypothetical protein